ncbi:Transketolase, pyridine binding domain-containing protein [Acidipropionibacterium acidipropionici ATCC 4875]|uniref:Transketolase, pyridine binding domain-containing protein n=1 Tax=Acidipropionibacterium acidipropionici (strain ATCC 4875 / DSM 20272 / JCM 6432 / NBRC 12425 / NCIMB 8070 / 4) TaxID=1171373 RepID=K7RWT6_ACIA4|nr:alpha-ketoacid dehydrogenase subunit beta [Acidipropionibacterium acidipropionici]AFV90871.1 Transketolase, pyridine binding domain-containing protein [Acidipropionibacterium acidipropionici ATCC 4875]
MTTQIQHDTQIQHTTRRNGESATDLESPGEQGIRNTREDRQLAAAASPALPPTGVLTLAKGLNAGLHDALATDPKALIMGEDVGTLGGVFRITDGLKAEFGASRVVDTPLAESGIVGTAIGLAMRGYHPCVEIQFDGFHAPAFDQIVSQLARYRARVGGAWSLPVTIRIPFGGGVGSPEHHSESPEAFYTGVPGLKVVACSSPDDAYWMARQAIASPDPVILFEPKRRYYSRGPVSPVAELGLHQARIVRPGTDITVLAWGPMVQTCVDAADAAAEEGTSLEVIDLRSLSPLDMATIEASVSKTTRAVVVHEAPKSGALGAEIAARLSESLYYVMEAPVLRVAGWDTPYPPSRAENNHIPDADRILDAVDRSLAM